MKTHGYESDLAALRAIITLYSEAAIDAGRWVTGKMATRSGRHNDLTTAKGWLEGIWAISDTDQDMRSIFEVEVAALQRSTSVRSMGPAMTKWMAMVVDDVKARLGGDMGRPLPDSPST
jgi:hypothetical protein